jgi:DNA-binding MarR family transcriptional regulator
MQTRHAPPRAPADTPAAAVRRPGGNVTRQMTTVRRATSDGEVTLVYLVGRVNQGIRREMRSRLAGWELSVPEFTAMSILNRRPHLSNAQLARRSLVTPQTMIEILAGLEDRGLVLREVDPAHGRILRAQLTVEGRELISAAELAIDDVQSEVLSGISEEHRRIALDVMFSMMQRLRSGLD